MDAFTPVIGAVRDLVDAALDGRDPRPSVSVGGSATLPPFAAVVFETPEDVEIANPTTSVPAMGGALGPYSLQFTVGGQMWAVRRNAAEAGSLVNEWFTLVMDALARDKTLGGKCVSATPVYARGGSVARDRGFLSAIDFGIRVKVHHTPSRN